MDNRVEVYFDTRNRFDRDILKRNIVTIILRPQDPSWNDYGIKSKFQVEVYRGGLVCEFKTKLIFENGEDSHDLVFSKSQESRFALVDSSKLPNFYSLIQSLKEYREVVSELEELGAKDILLAISDVVAISRYEGQLVNKKLKKILKSKAFNNSLIRSSEAAFVYYNAASILDGLRNEVSYLTLKKLNFNIQMDYSQSEEVELEFGSSSDLNRNMCVLIGENGTGKSQSLRSIVKSFTQSRKNKKEDTVFSRIIAIGIGEETQNAFPVPRKNKNVDYRRFQISRVAKSKRSLTSVELFFQLLRQPWSRGDAIAGKGRIEIFFDAIGGVLPLDRIGIPLDQNFEVDGGGVVSLDSIRVDNLSESFLLDITSSFLQEKEMVYFYKGKVYPLSSGQLSFIKIASILVTNVENGSLVLLDEPEVFLHPQLITQMHKLISTILRETGSYSIISTHSAYLVREIPRNHVYVFKRLNDRLEVVNPRIKTLGGDIGIISSFIFGDNDFGDFIEQLELKVKDFNKVEFHELLESLKDELPVEALTYLRNRWRGSIEKD